MSKAGIIKARIPRKKLPKPTADQYAQVLQELGIEVECATGVGKGAAILIKPGIVGGKPVILVRTLCLTACADKAFIGEIASRLQSDEGWEPWHVL